MAKTLQEISQSENVHALIDQVDDILKTHQPDEALVVAMSVLLGALAAISPTKAVALHIFQGVMRDIIEALVKADEGQFMGARPKKEWLQ